MIPSEEDFPPQKILEALAELPLDHGVPTLDTMRFSGGQYCVYKVEYPTGETWAVRIPRSVNKIPSDTIISIMEGEIDMIQELNRRGFRWAPKYLGANLTFQNPLGRPFLALSWIPGSTLEWSADRPTQPLRNDTLRQIALMQAERIETTLRECDAGYESAVEFFQRLVRNRRAGVAKNRFPGLTQNDCDSLEARLCNVLYTDISQTSAIDHGDEGPRNIICDFEHKVVGLLDYGFAQRTPLQVAAGFPLLLKTSSPKDPISPSLQKDRLSYAEALKSLQSEYPRAVPHILRIQSEKDIDYRSWVMESARSKGVHVEMARLGWKLPCEL